jgi:hypothetical protein
MEPAERKEMKRLIRPTYLALIALAVLGFVLIAQPVRAEVNCLNVSGTLTLQPDGSAIVTGDLAGILYGQILSVRTSGDGAMHLVAQHQWVTAAGEVHTMDQVVLSPVAPNVVHVNNRMTIVGGTGMFEGATGAIHVQGFLLIRA